MTLFNLYYCILTVHSIRKLAPVFFVVCILLLFRASTIAQNHSDSLPVVALKKLSIEELLGIEITSVSKRPEKLTDVASAIQVITQEDIRKSGATCVPEALRLATNLQVAQVNSSQWAISARGFNNVLANKLLVMIDGRTVYTPLYAGVFWDAQNLVLEDVERIEVISGPGGALWGANAVNGVINIITKSAQNTQGLFVEAGVGSELRRYGNLRYGGKIGNDVYYRAYGTGFKRDNSINIDDSKAHDAWTMAQGGFQMDWDATQKDVVSFQSNAYSNRPNPDGTAPIKATGHNMIGRWVHSHSEKSNLQIQIYYDQTWRDFRNGFTEKLRTYDLDAQHRFQFGRHHQIVWGAGYRMMAHNVENLELFMFTPGKKNLRISNIFVQDQITLVKERLHLTLGSKFEHNSYTGLQLQPSGRIAWSLQGNQSLWASVSRAVRTPARIDRDFFLFITPDRPLIRGNNEFKSEELLAYELGWRIQSKSTFSLSLSTFYNIYDNIRSAEPGPAPSNIPITFSNGVEGDTYGFEFAGTFQPVSWWRLRGGYTFLKKDLSIKPTSQDLNGGRAESDDPENQFLIQSMMDLPGNIEFGFVVRHIDELPNPRVAAYWGLDVRLAWMPVRSVELSVVGQNLLDKLHVEFVPSSPAPREIERSLYAKVACRF